jgi:hypothetical protein
MKNILPILIVVMITMSSCGLMVGGLLAVTIAGVNPNQIRSRPPIDFPDIDSAEAEYEEVDSTVIEEAVEEVIEEEPDSSKPDRTLPPDLLSNDEPVDAGTTELKLFKPEVDLGTIEYGDSIRHTFKYKNIGKTDFVIEQYTVGCGCTEISSPKKRLTPGETGEITLQFNSKEKDGPGEYTSDAMLIGNTGMGFVEFMMKIKVVEKKE